MLRCARAAAKRAEPTLCELRLLSQAACAAATGRFVTKRNRRSGLPELCGFHSHCREFSCFIASSREYSSTSHRGRGTTEETGRACRNGIHYNKRHGTIEGRQGGSSCPFLSYTFGNPGNVAVGSGGTGLVRVGAAGCRACPALPPLVHNEGNVDSNLNGRRPAARTARARAALERRCGARMSLCGRRGHQAKACRAWFVAGTRSSWWWESSQVLLPLP
jgi:hypothetical protein